MYYIRHNFIGWIPPFVLGILFAKFQIKTSFSNFKQVLLALLLLSFFIVSSIISYLWIFSPLFFIVLMIIITRDIRCTFMEWIGTISASIFVIHPIIRFLSFHYYNPIGHPIMVFTIYFVSIIIISLAYQKVYFIIVNRFLLRR